MTDIEVLKCCNTKVFFNFHKFYFIDSLDLTLLSNNNNNNVVISNFAEMMFLDR